MDPYRFGYSPMIERPKLSWPKGARVAVWVCPNIEHYEYVPAEVRVRNPWPRMRRLGLGRHRCPEPRLAHEVAVAVLAAHQQGTRLHRPERPHVCRNEADAEPHA